MWPKMNDVSTANPYYLEPRTAPYAFKPYDRKRVRRDLHDARTVSVKLSAQERRRKDERRASVEAQIVALRARPGTA